MSSIDELKEYFTISSPRMALSFSDCQHFDTYLRIQKWYTIYKDHVTLEDYEIHDGMGLELYYN